MKYIKNITKIYEKGDVKEKEELFWKKRKQRKKMKIGAINLKQ